MIIALCLEITVIFLIKSWFEYLTFIPCVDSILAFSPCIDVLYFCCITCFDLETKSSLFFINLHLGVNGFLDVLSEEVVGVAGIGTANGVEEVDGVGLHSFPWLVFV